jgi:hypothetical protein
MLWIAFDFGRMTFVAFHKHRRGDPGKRHGGREEQRTARNQVLGLLDVGDDLFGRLLRAGADPGERERRAHELQELAAPLRVVPLRRLLGKLAVQVFAELSESDSSPRLRQ